MNNQQKAEQLQAWIRRYRKSDAYKNDIEKIGDGDCDDVQGQVEITGIEDLVAKTDNPAIRDMLIAIGKRAEPLSPVIQNLKARLEAIIHANFASVLMDVPEHIQDAMIDNLGIIATTQPGGLVTLWADKDNPPTEEEE
jgi:hypothetical protein